MRLFVSIPVNITEVRTLLKSIQNKVNGYPQEYMKLHITLAFIPNISNEPMSTLIKMLGNYINPRPPVLISADSTIELWGNDLVLPVTPCEHLLNLRTDICNLLSALNIDWDDSNPYVPHITLVKKQEGPVSVETEPFTFNSRKISVVKSTLTLDGSVYEVLADFNFTNEVLSPTQGYSRS
ncbi:MAG: hypothetical protein CMF48_02240 [Legionellales bacterium]|nr:hypothetical protein [Legionellales bacterium]|tara:strand:+ start:111 stop:653 length:543 start_codon:yes stop_codon:yes gene_type:complete